MIGVFGQTEQVDSFTTWLETKCLSISNKHSSATALVFFAVVIIPAVFTPTAAIFGSILAAAEGWTVKQGYLYVISNLSGLGNPLTPEVLARVISWDLFLFFLRVLFITHFTIRQSAFSSVSKFSSKPIERVRAVPWTPRVIPQPARKVLRDDGAVSERDLHQVKRRARFRLIFVQA